MEDYLDQIDAGVLAGFYYLALGGALAVPDMCAALAATDGRATGARYIAWFDTNVAGAFYDKLSGAQCYRFRCAFLHQGATGHPEGYERIVFVEPGATGSVFHCNILGGLLNIDVRIFCTEITQAARTWLGIQASSEPFETNHAATIRRYPNGYPGAIGGVPVIG